MPPRHQSLHLTILAAAITAALSAQAQEGQPDAQARPAAIQKQEAGDSKMQKVEVRGSADAYDPRRDDTASKIVVNHDEIVKYGDTNVLDVMKRLPGVTVNGNAIRMRGLGSGYTQILVNGERAPAGFSIDSLAPDVIERIEVLRAASAEFSTQSIAGTINIVLKKAIKNRQRELKLGAARGNGFFGPNANLQMSDRAGKLSYSVSANLFHQHFDRQPAAVEEGFDLSGRQVLLRNSVLAENGRFTAVNVSPRLNWSLANGDTLTSQTFVNVNRFANNVHTQVTTPFGSPPPNPDLTSRMSNENEFFRSDLNWVHKNASGSQLELKVGALAGGLGNTLRRQGLGPSGAAVLDSVVESKGTDRGVSSTGKFSTPLFEGHSLAVGWDGGYNTRDDARDEHNEAVDGRPAFDLDERFKGRVTRMAVYAQDEWNITPRWSLYLGARWESIQTRTEGNTFATAHSRSSVWSPLMQTLWKVPGTKSDQLRFAVTRTYKAPGLQSLIPRRFPSANNSSTEPDFQGNPNLKPELALGIDASYEHYFGEGALLSASTSWRRIDDYTRSAVLLVDGRWVSMPVNDGQARTRGVELEAKFPLKTFFSSAPAIDVRASLSRNWSTVDSVPGPHNRLDQQTPVSATFGIDYKAGALTTGGSFAFKNGGEVRVSERQTAYVSVRREMDIYALWKFSVKNQLRVAVSNVLGQDWINSGSYASDDSVVRRTSVYPATVTVRATMEMKF